MFEFMWGEMIFCEDWPPLKPSKCVCYFGLRRFHASLALWVGRTFISVCV